MLNCLIELFVFQMAVHLALLGVSEYVFSMTALDLEGLVVDLSTGQLFYTDFAFDIIRKFPEGADKPQCELAYPVILSYTGEIVFLP